MMSFRRLLAVLGLAVTVISCDLLGVKKDEADLSVTIGSEEVGKAAGEVGVTVSALGAWTLDIDFVDGDGWAELSRTSGTGYRSNVLLRYERNNTAESRSLYVVLTSESGAVAECRFTQGADDAGASGGTANSTDCGWLELPETREDDGLVWGWHGMTISGKPVRNYSFYFSKKDRLSFWVAYPLNQDLMGTKGMRVDEFVYDGLLPESWQANLFRSYSGHYDRGHQCPARDRSASVEANAQTFYATNMTPQRSEFNQGIWQKLESSVQGWALSLNSATDTLYVVTGCVVDADSGSTTDRAGNRCTVPTAYYKALLRYKSYSYDACAVWLDHDTDAERATFSDMMSIDELEKKLGFDLFVNLPSKVGGAKAASIETKAPSANAWSL